MRTLRIAGVWCVAGLLASCGGSPTRPTGVQVSSISPPVGSTLGGTTVTIVGANFAAGATVTLGGAPAPDVTVNSSNTLTATTPQHAAGVVDVAVSAGGKTATLSGAFTFVAPAPSFNAPPRITSITVRGTRANEPAQFADLGEEVNVTASVEDIETPVSQLTYEYASSGGGTFSGSGSSVKWRAPQGGSPPFNVTITLTVIERYASVDPSGLPITSENRATGTTTVFVHDSVTEVGAMARQFLEDFSRQVRPPDLVVADFRPTCFTGSAGGKASELADVVFNQNNFTITQWRVDPPRVNVQFGGQCTLFQERFRPSDACALVTTEWSSTQLTQIKDDPPGTRWRTTGIDQVSAAYRDNRWWLCESDFLGTTVRATGGLTAPTGFFKK